MNFDNLQSKFDEFLWETIKTSVWTFLGLCVVWFIFCLGRGFLFFEDVLEHNLTDEQIVEEIQEQRENVREIAEYQGKRYVESPMVYDQLRQGVALKVMFSNWQMALFWVALVSVGVSAVLNVLGYVNETED
ncbi:MAG: hypothetical protein F4W92_08915 [Gammaproteobacteria bacterium]|nr:hypothetical protein [Gammaproteobacteria bacterium]